MEACRERELKTETGNLSVKLKQKYQDSFWYLNEGINLEERGKNKDAILCYEKGLRLLDEGLRIVKSMNSTEQSNVSPMKKKIERAREQVRNRLVELNKSEKQVETKIKDVSTTQTGFSAVDWEDVIELLHITEGVQLFQVDTASGECEATAPTDLKVCQFVKEYKDLLVPPAFLLCGEWMFPLDPGLSPVLKSTSNTYVFPDVDVLSEPEENDNCIGLLFSKPVAEELIDRFERILKCYSKYKDCSKPTRPPPPREAANWQVKKQGEKKDVSNLKENVQAGAKLISAGIEKGATISGKLVEKGAEKLKTSISANETPTAVDPKLAQNVQHMQTVTGAALQVSGYLVSALAALTCQIGKHLAPIVREQGTKLLPDKYKTENGDDQQKIDTFLELAVAGVQGWATVFLSLEQAGKIMYKSLSNATVGLVQHKYGQDAADVTGDAMKVAGNTAMVYLNVKNLGVKAIAKRTAKDTAKTMLSIEHDKRSNAIKYDCS